MSEKIIIRIVAKYDSEKISLEDIETKVQCLISQIFPFIELDYIISREKR